jgi:hypothetical protein
MDSVRVARFTTITLWLIAGGLFIYALLRAYFIPITHDEAFSYLWYAKESFLEIAKSPPPYIPNNHILNTLLFKLSNILLGHNAFTVRLPNLIFYGAFLIYSIRWIKRITINRLLQVAGFLLLNANVYLLDFFALGRGYGLGIAFLFIGMFYLFEWVKTEKNKHLWLSLIGPALATYANFTFLYAYLAILAVSFLLQIKYIHSFKSFLKRLLPLLLTSLALAWLIIIPIKKISGALFGGASGFIDNTIGSLSFSYLYATHAELTDLITYSVVILCIAGWFYIVLQQVLNKQFYRNPLALSGLILFLTFFAQFLQHQILGTPYITHRTALMYFPLFFVFLIYFLLEVYQNRQAFRVFASSFLLVFGLLASFNFVQHMNTERTLEWPYDAHYHKIIFDLDTLRSNQTISLGNSWLFEPGLNFYRETKPLPWLEEVSRDYLFTERDFYLVDFGIHPDFLEENTFAIKEVKRYSTSVVLYQRVQ